jgi:hypothetical protein
VLDGPAELVTRRGCFEVDSETNAVKYVLDGISIAPAHVRTVTPYIFSVSDMFNPDYQSLWKVMAFPLGGDRWMVPQPDSSTCSAACEAALCMSAGMSFDAATDGFYMRRRTGADLEDSLCEKTGVAAPIVLRSALKDGAPSPECLAKLRQALQENGAAILSCNGHNRVLYELSLDSTGEAGAAVFHDPFHRTYCEIQFGPGKTALWALPGIFKDDQVRATLLPKTAVERRLQQVQQALQDAPNDEATRAYVTEAYQRDLAQARALPIATHKLATVLKDALDPARCANETRAGFLRTVRKTETELLSGSDFAGVRRTIWRPLVAKVAHDFRTNGGDLNEIAPGYLNGLADKHAASLATA